MKRASKFLSVLLSLVMVFTLVPTTVFAAGKPTITTQPKAVTAYVGTTAKFSVVASDATSYLWQTKTSADGNWINTSFATSKTANLQVTATTGRDGYQYRCKVTNSAGSVYTNAVTLTVSEKPVVKTNPVSVKTAAGTTAKFSVVADGATSYLWQTKTSADGSWKNTSFATSTTANLEVPATTARNGYQFRCKITNAKGSVYSKTATLTVVSKPTITTQPKAVEANEGTTATFTVKANGATGYLWQTKTSATGSWKNTSFATSQTATLKVPATTARNGYQFRCKVTNEAGSVYTNAVTLTVKPAITVVSQPADVLAQIGTTAGFDVVAGGTGLTYLWQTKTSSTGSWIKTSFATSTTPNLKVSATKARNGYQYRCKITDVNGVVSYTAPATLSVYGVTSNPSSVTKYEGETATFKVSAIGNGLTYLWQTKTSATGNWINTSFSTSKTATLKVSATNARNGYQYRCRITTAEGKTFYSDTATLTIDNSLRIVTQPQSQTGVVRDTLVQFSVEATGGKAPYTYKWQVDGYEFVGDTERADFVDLDTTIMSSTPNEQTMTIDFTGVLSALCEYDASFRCVVTDAEGTTVYSDAAKITTAAKIYTQPKDSTYAGDNIQLHNFSIDADGTAYPLTYRWQYTTDTIGGEFVDITGEESWYYPTVKNVIGVTPNTNIIADNIRFRCIVTDAAGIEMISDTATFITTLEIATQPADVFAKVGTNHVFNVECDSTLMKSLLTYSWQYKCDDTQDYVPITEADTWATGFDTKELGVSVNEQLFAGNYSFRCVITPKVAVVPAVTSNAAALYMYPHLKTPVADAVAHIGDTVQFKAEVVGGAGNENYTWYYREASGQNGKEIPKEWGSGKWSDTLTVKVLSEEFYNYKFFCSIYKGERFVTYDASIVRPPVKIVTQPQDVTAIQGATVSFVTEVGDGTAPYTYKWQYTYDTLDDYVDFDNSCTWASGFATSRLEINVSNDIFRSEYMFRCVVTDANGDSVISDEAQVINGQFRIVEQPENYESYAGEPITLHVGVTGGREPYTYQWKYTTTAVTGNVSSGMATGTDTDTLVITNPTDYLISNYSFYCIVEDGNGDIVTTNTVKLVPGSVKITQQPQNVKADTGDTVSFSVAAKGGTAPYTYQWMHAYGTNTPYTNVGSWATGYTTDTMSFEITDKSEFGMGYRYVCKVTDKNGDYVISEPAYPVYDGDLCFYTEPQFRYGNVGDSITFNAAAIGGNAPYTYKWQYLDETAIDYMDLTSAQSWASGYNTDSLTVYVEDMYIFDYSYRFRCVVADSDGNEIISNGVGITEAKG